MAKKLLLFVAVCFAFWLLIKHFFSTKLGASMRPGGYNSPSSLGHSAATSKLPAQDVSLSAVSLSKVSPVGDSINQSSQVPVTGNDASAVVNVISSTPVANPVIGAVVAAFTPPPPLPSGGQVISKVLSDNNGGWLLHQVAVHNPRKKKLVASQYEGDVVTDGSGTYWTVSGGVRYITPYSGGQVALNNPVVRLWPVGLKQ